MFTFSKEELSDLLSKVFDEGCGGYQDLKEGFLTKVLEDLENKQATATKIELDYYQYPVVTCNEDWQQITDQATWNDLISRTLYESVPSEYQYRVTI